ncbi:DUF3667 domain-containing protein [Polaribacter sp.]|nr:DUF3667 domain-containing protein [Polaribacter sp.]
MFNGIFNFDAKFWRTIIPLLTKPGEVSKMYVEGKRQRYSNPFRFYLAISIIFFLLIGVYNTKQKYKELTKVAISKKIDFDNISKDSLVVLDSISQKKKDSILKDIENTIDQFPFPMITEETKNEILEETKKGIEKEDIENYEDYNNNINFKFGKNDNKFNKFLKFIKKHPKVSTDDALDSLNYEKTLSNRFLFSRAKTIDVINNDRNTQKQFFNQALSYGSVGLFIFLPVFTLFLMLLYIRKKLTYVDHLIFIFHTQTVFFLLFSIYLIMRIFDVGVFWVFVVLFSIYLFLAMRKFYQQSIAKTFFKYCILNFLFITLSSIAASLIFLVSFALY